MPENVAPKKPDCFARLEQVFPPGADGARSVPQSCWGCPERVECLRRAVGAGSGKSVIQDELAERREKALGGVGGFLSRWSRLKNRSRQGE